MRALVIGYGSIGSRHARILAEIGCKTAVVSKRSLGFPNAFKLLGEALIEHQPDYVVIANPTSQHHETLISLVQAGYEGRVLVEKPVFHQAVSLPDHNFRNLSVGYNLRFHPLVKKLYELIKGEKILSVQVYAGQYLPDWRPGTDYRLSYSSKSDQGGGVLRDLSHELDYINWLCGPWSAVAALGGHFSDLEIDSDDLFSLLIEAEACATVSVQLSYLDRTPRRRILVNTQRDAIEVDLVAGEILINGVGQKVTVERDYTYREMHHAALSDDLSVLCSLDEALLTLKLIEAAEQSSRYKEWVRR